MGNIHPVLSMCPVPRSGTPSAQYVSAAFVRKIRDDAAQVQAVWEIYTQCSVCVQYHGAFVRQIRDDAAQVQAV